MFTKCHLVNECNLFEIAKLPIMNAIMNAKFVNPKKDVHWIVRQFMHKQTLLHTKKNKTFYLKPSLLNLQ